VTNIYTREPDGRIADIDARPFAPIDIGATDTGEFRSWDPRTGGGARRMFTPRGGEAITPTARVRLVRR
jgi:hypothetical protein